MDRKGSFILGSEFFSWFFRFLILFLIGAYVHSYIIASVQVKDDTSEVLFDNFISRARYCVKTFNGFEEDSLEDKCFKNPDYYSIKLIKGDETRIAGDKKMFDKCKSDKRFTCREKSLNINGEYYKLEVVYNAYA